MRPAAPFTENAADVDTVHGPPTLAAPHPVPSDLVNESRANTLSGGWVVVDVVLVVVGDVVVVEVVVVDELVVVGDVVVVVVVDVVVVTWSTWSLSMTSRGSTMSL